jgi:hypothetical protein
MGVHSLQGAFMTHTYESLKKMTIAQLREVAKDTHHEAVQGFSQLNKEHLLPALCLALGIDAHEHHAAHGELKLKTKERMAELRAKRAQAVQTHDHELLHAVRREYHHLNHKLRADARKPM